MLLTDSPDFAHLLGDQASSAESFSSPTQSKMVSFIWIPISDAMHRGTRSMDIHLFLHDLDSWMNSMLVWYLLVEHPFAAGFGQTCKAWRVLAASLSYCKDPDGKVVYGVQGIGQKATKKQFEELMVFMKGFVGHIPFESGTDDTDSCTKLLAGLENLFKAVSGLENEKYVTSSQKAARKNEDRARAESLRNAFLGNLTPSHRKPIKSHTVMKLESNSAKKRPANNSPGEMYRILGSFAERPQQRMDMKAQREFFKENRKNRQLELKAEHAKQVQAIELQKLELQIRASETLFTIN